MKTLERIRFWAESTPNRIAYRYIDRTLSFRQLWLQSSLLAASLQHCGIRTCLLYGGKEPEMLIGMIGCLLAGVTYVPVADPTPPRRVSVICDECRAGLIISSSERLLCSVPRVTADELISSAQEKSAFIAEDNPAYIIFTSGSTGIPKGVPISRENLEHFTEWILHLFPLSEQKHASVLNQASFSFDLSVADIFYSLCGGHTLCALPSEVASDPGALLRFFETREITVAVCTPTFIKLCMLNPEFCSTHLPRLQVIYSCGEQLEPSVAEKLFHRFPDLHLINAYGPTEATSAVCACEITRQDVSRSVLPAGKCSTAACDILIMDDEIVLSGESVFSGYLNSKDSGLFSTNNREYYRTGDIGKIHNDLLYCLGRKDRQIKWKGYRIELDEIESALMQVPEVADCAVIAKKTPQGQVRFLKAFVVTSVSIREEEIIDRLKQSLPAYMIPKTIQIMKQLPKTNNGKCDRKALEQL